MDWEKITCWATTGKSLLPLLPSLRRNPKVPEAQGVSSVQMGIFISEWYTDIHFRVNVESRSKEQGAYITGDFQLLYLDVNVNDAII